MYTQKMRALSYIGAEKITFPPKPDIYTDIHTYRRTDIRVYRVASLLIKLDNITIVSCKHYKYVPKSKIITSLKWNYRLFGKNDRVATLFTFYLTSSDIIMPNLKLIGLF